jgi:hypothetical protein
MNVTRADRAFVEGRLLMWENILVSEAEIGGWSKLHKSEPHNGYC